MFTIRKRERIENNEIVCVKASSLYSKHKQTLLREKGVYSTSFVGWMMPYKDAKSIGMRDNLKRMVKNEDV